MFTKEELELIQAVIEDERNRIENDELSNHSFNELETLLVKIYHIK